MFSLIIFTLLFISSSFGINVPVNCNDCLCSNPVVDCRDVSSVCDVDGNKLDCSFKKLRASFSSESAKWANVKSEEINFEHNFIGRVVEFPGLNLTTIIFRYNRIVEIDDQAFINLAYLEDLDLSYNELSVLAPEVFLGPYSAVNYLPLNIASLNLSYNQFTTLDQNVFEHLPRLQRLMLRGNPLGGSESGDLNRETVVAIAGAPSLQALDLSETGLSSLPGSFLAALKDLKELILMGNNFMKLPTAELSFSKSLQIINLNNNPIIAISTKERFPDMPTVTQLHISHMPELLRIESQGLHGLTGLRYLSCANNDYFDYIDPNALASNNLTRLELHDNSLHYLPENLTDWKKLTTVHLLGNRWSCDCDNQWMLDKLVPQIGDQAQGLICSQPESMKGALMQKLSERQSKMTCLDHDEFGNHVENNNSILVGSFLIIILVLVGIGAFLLYRQGRLRRGEPFDYKAIYQQHMRDDYGS